MLLVVKCHHQHSNCLFYAWKKHAHTHTHTPSMVLFSHPPPHVLKLGKKTLKKPRISSRWRNGTVLERPLQWKSQISKRRYSRGKALASASASPNQGLTLGGRLAFCPSTLSTLPPLEGTMAPGWRAGKCVEGFEWCFICGCFFVKRFTRPCKNKGWLL